MAHHSAGQFLVPNRILEEIRMATSTDGKANEVMLEKTPPVPGHAGVVRPEEPAPAEYINGVPYWRTPLFLGSFWAIGFGVLACYAGFAMPANTLALIDADIGESRCLFPACRG